jgi:hypothetical protein
MTPTLEDQERHLLVKVIDRILYKLDDLVRPYVHKILVVIEPLLIDEDYYARVEGREIIANLSKAAGVCAAACGARWAWCVGCVVCAACVWRAARVAAPSAVCCADNCAASCAARRHTRSPRRQAWRR